MNFDTLIEIMAQHGITRLAHIASELDVSPQAVSNWKARDQVPYKIVVAIQGKYGGSMDDGEENEDKRTDSDTSRQKDGGQATKSHQPSPISPSIPSPYAQFPYPEEDYFEEDSTSFSDLFLFLARQIRAIIFTPTIFCILAIIHVFFNVTPVYKSTSKIMSSSVGSEMSQAAGIAAQYGIALPTGNSKPNWVYPEIIKSRTLARSIIKREFNTIQYASPQSLLQILTSENVESNLNSYNLEISAINSFLNMVNVSEDLKSRIVTIDVYASESDLAADINKALIEELDAHQQKYNKAKTSATKQFIEERIIDTGKELMAAEEDLKVFMDRNRRIENSPALQLEQQRLGREVTVLTSVFTTLKQQLEKTKIEEVKKSNYVIILDSPERPLVPSKPKKKQAVILAGVLGIVFGIVIGFFRERVGSAEVDEKEKLLKARELLIKNIFSFVRR